MDHGTVVDQLRDTTCAVCEQGALIEGTYKETRAVLCDECGTPLVRFF